MKREKICIREAVIVEGRYDKNSVSQVVDTLILETNGFGIYQNKELIAFLKTTAEKQGLIVMTDSDSAGFQIRNYLKSVIPDQFLKHAYIPEIPGREKRKKQPSKEGLLGVEGIEADILQRVILESGATVYNGKVLQENEKEKIQRIDFYLLGLSGSKNSKTLRERICAAYEIPKKVNQTDLIKILNKISSKEELKKLVSSL